MTEMDKSSIAAQMPVPEQARRKALEEKIAKSEAWLYRVQGIAALLLAVVVFCSSWMAENWFSYKTTVTVNPEGLVFCLGSGMIIASYYVVTTLIKKRIAAGKKELDIGE